MPPSIVYIDKLDYSGGLAPDAMREKLAEYFNKLTATSFEKSDIVDVLYNNGATYVNLDMGITVRRYTTSYEKYVKVMSDTDQRYIIPENTISRFYSHSSELPGVTQI